MSILKSIAKALTARPGETNRQWLNENCRPYDLTDSDISAIISYLKKPKKRYLIIGVVCLVGSVILRLTAGDVFPFISIGAIGTGCCVLTFLQSFRIPSALRTVVAMLKSRQFKAYEFLVTDRVRRRNSSEEDDNYYIMAGSRSFTVTEEEYRSVRPGQNAVAIVSDVYHDIGVFDLKCL